MKSRIWTIGVALCLVLSGAGSAFGTDYYIDDASDTGDLWTPTKIGNDAADGLTPTTPKATLGNLIGTCTLQPGDVVYIDTGTYAPAVISNTVVGVVGNPIVFQGSTNLAAGGTTFTGSGYILSVRGWYLHFQDIRAVGGSAGIVMQNASYCNFNRISAVSNANWSFRLETGSNSNALRRCIMLSIQGNIAVASGVGNYLENCIGISLNEGSISPVNGSFSNMVGCVAMGKYAFGGSVYMPDRGNRNVFYPTDGIHSTVQTLSDLQRANTNWFGNTYADPNFFNAGALDFHLLSASGFVSNGTWVVDPAVGYSPAIDFGPAGAAVGDEPVPNGGRVNIGLYGGTAEASKSRTGPWTFAMSFNDGGTLIKTGRLEWVASTNLAGANVALEYSTNNGAGWSSIVTAPATNESYTWGPSVSHPAVLWRVRDPASGFASTNAKPFSIRANATNAFSFYVNDGSLTGDLYCGAMGNNDNLGISSNSPKRSLQAILEAYQLRGGDVVYVDTGDYTTNFTTTITAFDSGTAGSPLRIVGSPRGSVLGSGSTSRHVLELNGTGHIELSDLQLAGPGNHGFYATASSNLVVRNVQSMGNNGWGFYLAGASVQNSFDHCLAANNGGGFYAGQVATRSNQWSNGVMWGNPTILSGHTNAPISVSNSILGIGTALFAGAVVPGDHNVVWDTGVGLTYSSFSALQTAGLGWERSLYADPQFADAADGDFHLLSKTGRYDPGTTNFVTTDTEYSPAIDFGNPSASFAIEPAPNGSRLNAGLFGNTAQASKSRTNAWLQALSLMDGGTLDAQAGAWLHWTGGAYAPTSTVTIWLSRDNGASWETMATGVLATNGAYYYQNTSTNDPSSLYAYWKVTLAADTNVFSQTPTNFNYRNGSYAFYVNDGSTAGDVYCTVAGSEGNLGVSAGAPMANLHTLINTYKLTPGDRVYVDTGVYTATNTVVLTAQDSGVATNWIEIVGSTNRAAGGSVFGQGGFLPLPAGFMFQAGASNIVLRNILLTNRVVGVGISNCLSITLDGVEVRNGGRGFEVGANAREVELTHCVGHGNGVGAYLQGAAITNVVLRNSVFWENTTNAIQTASGLGSLVVENSVLGSTRTNAVLYNLASLAGTTLDYNGLYAGPLARVGTLGGVAVDNVAAWQALSGGQDAHSVPGDPQLANPAQYDYHLKTERSLGRRLPNGLLTSDAVSSPLLDAGNPATGVGEEPAPNGGRVNIGRFGGTWEASMALSSPWLKAISFGDAGSVTNSVVPLLWTAGGDWSNETVKVEVSVDGGNTWSHTVVSGIPATNGVASWTVTGLPDTPAGVWRVVCLENGDISAQSTNFFAIRNNPLNIYVGKVDTNENAYASGPGAGTNWMASAEAPLDSLVTAFDRFDLEAGDQIWVDTGTYLESVPVLVGMKDSGTSNDPVRVTGNTNQPYGGTVLGRTSRPYGAYGVQFAHAQGVQFSALAVSNAFVGIHAENSPWVALDRVRVGYCTTNAIFAGSSTRIEITRSIVDQNLYFGLMAFTGSVVQASGNLMRGNGMAGLCVRGGNVEFKNNIVEATGSGRYGYYRDGGGILASDYNNIRVTDGASVAGYVNASDRFLIDWQISTAFSNDVNSTGYGALFADEAADDFHLKSEYGRYADGAWVNDTNTSRLIDLGDPDSDFANEPADNGGRINVGLYGNTAEASKSRPPGTGSLVPLTMSDGGTVRGTVELHWSWSGFVGSETVLIQFSGDGGATWTNIGSKYVNQGPLAWTTTNVSSTAMGVWRILTTDSNVIGQTETLFAVKNDPLSYYINDAGTQGDVYCSAAGSAANTGLSSNSPLNSLATLLGRYKVEHGDTVYVDTGIYRSATPLAISIPSLAPTNTLVIQGSTNEAAGGSVFTNSGSGAVIDLQNSRGVELRDLRLQGGGKGLLLTQSSSNLIQRVRTVGTRGNAFELSTQSDLNRFIQCAALSFSSTGFHMAHPLTATIAPATNQWINGVISPVPAASNGTAVATGVLMGAQSGRIYVSNSVFVANSPAHVIYASGRDTIRGDYNCYHRPYTNLIARVALGTLFGMDRMDIEYLGDWSAWIQSESNSLAADPLFADLAGGDLHPKSAGGRWNPATTNWVTDTETSPLIDSAPLTAPWGNETAPNGSRANLGVYGNTPQASRTPTDGTFVLLSLNQGDVVRGTTLLKWIARGGATNAGHLVNIQLSTNSGESFATIGTGPAAAGSYSWNSTTNPSIQTARWRVQSQSQPTWVTASERDFVIHNTTFTFYVNDGSTSNDVYTTAIGVVENTGLSANSPLPSLAEVLARYDLEPGDQVLVDTGDYLLAAPVLIGFADCGTSAEPVVIQGSTNHPGSTFKGAGLQIENARGVAVQNLKFTEQSGWGDVVAVSRAEDIDLSSIDILGGSGNGTGITGGSNVWLRNFSVAYAATNGVASVASFNTRLEFGTIWSNGTAQVLSRNQLISGNNINLNASFMTVSNCVLGSYGLRIPVYEVRGNLYADHNDIFLGNGALAALSYLGGFGREFDSVGNWAASEFGQDGSTLSHNPRFSNPGAGDFHLMSQGGRWVPGSGTWTNDAETSPLLDAGNPALACLEPDPNGGRVNIGRYGNTGEASKTPANGALTLISFNDGGKAAGSAVEISWLARGVTTGVTVSISYSADGGNTWSNLATGLSATNGYWIWNSTLSEQSVQGKLKIEGTDGSVAISAGVFAVRNAPFVFYINDNSTSNDMYCTAPGDNSNSGLSSNAPMADLNALLAKYDLDSSTNGADIVYIDTGLYKGNETWRITQADSAGDADLPPVIFQGSTHSLVNGTVLDRNRYPVGIQADYAVGIRLRNMVVSNTVGSAVRFNDCYNAAAEWMAVGVANIGFQLTAGSRYGVSNCVVYSASRGIVVEAWNQATNTMFPVLEHNVIWESDGYAIQLGGINQATVRHNILSVLPGRYVYGLGPTETLYADYNSFWLGEGGRVFEQTVYRNVSPVPIIYDTVGKWAAVSGNDLHSFDGDPLLADPAGRDFHLKSQVGRWDPVAKAWTTDAVSSPLIDAGRVDSTAWENEPAPNGGRVNIGLFGGSAQASKSPTNSALYLLTLNQGGVASGLVSLNWMAAGQATGHTVRVEVSIDNGASWILVGAGIPAYLDGVSWNSANQPSSALGLWRVTDETEAGVSATSALNFVLHNGPVHYYVNDDSTDGDVFCSVVGSGTNTGTSANSPKRWVAEILDTYNLEPGDIIHVDTGRYQTSEPTVIGDLDAGDISQDPSRQVNIVGSTNVLAGGSLYLMSDPTLPAFQLDGTYGIRLSQLGIMNASNALVLDNSYFIGADWLEISGCENGIYSLSSSNLLVSHSAMVGNRNAGIYFSAVDMGSLRMESGILWSNRYGIYLAQGYAEAYNTIFGMVAPGSFGYYMHEDRPPIGLSGDYNNLFVGGSGSAAGGLQTGGGSSARTSVYATASAWALGTGNDVHSLAHNPELADSGNGDYHLKSKGGRYKAGTGWVYDSATSPLIDAGSPASTGWLLEPDPNGRRLNIGRYGGSPEASKTALSGALTLISLNDGGYASGLVNLQWTATGAATNYTVCLEFSPDNGISWTNIACGVPAVSGGYAWNSVPYGASALSLWRAFCEEDMTISAASQAPFILRNGGTIPYYVNDANPTGDVYCTAIGSDANDGLTPATPKASLQTILDTYELAPEDVVYVDAGTYPAGSPPITISQTDSGYSNLYVTIQGSTNPVVPTVFVAPSFSTPHVFSLQYAVNVRLKDLAIRNANTGVEAFQTIGCEFDGVRIENNRSIGLSLNKCASTRLVRSVLWKNSSPTGGVAAALADSALTVENSVLWGSPIALSLGISSLTVTNSVLDASGPDGRIYRFGTSASASNGFRGDYNSYTRRNGALICEQQLAVGGSDLYNDLPAWSALNGSDRHSMTIAPAFANEVGGDFHPMSTGGRFTGTGWINDMTLSPLVDAGSLDWDFTNEPEPNGGIVNIGAYGNTEQASMTQTNPPWLRVVSYNNAGVMSGNVLLYWLHGGMPADTPVRLEYSTDYEISWNPIASNIWAGTREYEWDVTSIPLALALNWRVVSQANTNIWDVSDEPVVNKPGVYDYYVNDAYTNGDVWCQGAGMPPGYGLGYANPTNPALPIDSLSSLLAHYPIGAGDRVYVDTGVYPVTFTNTILLGADNMGTSESPLRIYGSTNHQAGGALLLGNGTANGIDLQNTRNIEIHGLRIASNRNGVAIQNVSGATLAGVELFKNRTNGVWVSGSSGVEVRRSRLWNNGRHGFASTDSKGAERILNSTLWGNAAGAVQTAVGLVISNSILCVTNAMAVLTEEGQGASILGDYNLYGVASGGLVGTNSSEKVSYANLRQWQAKSRDIHSLVADPLFVGPATGDFHLQSRAGYWTGSNWAVSAATSWAIDAGDPADPAATNEFDSASRINLGAYGGTSEASKSDSSVAELLPTTLRDGGVAPDGQPLYWLYRGFTATNLLRIEYSPDRGGTWIHVAGGIEAGAAPFTWFSTEYPSPEALWRIVLQTDTNVVGTTLVPFTFRPAPLTYYVNDDSQVGDVYTSGIGSSTNRGYVSNSPLHSIQAVLDKYQLAGGDGIKVDTGDYELSNSVFLSVLNSGDSTNRVYFQGSTNSAAGGTLLLDASGGQIAAFELASAHDIDIAHFHLVDFSNGVNFVEYNARCTISDLDIERPAGPGVMMSLSQRIQMERVVVRNGMTNGMFISQSPFVSAEGCVLWSNRASALFLGQGGTIDLTNSVLEASGVGDYCYESPTNVAIQADYNNLYIRNGAQIASIDGLQYEKLPQWVRARTQDRHSLSTDPLFHDPDNGDFHLRSATGRYQPGAGWVQDAPATNLPDYSPLIDMGAPRSTWSNEPAPNGGRRNIGLYGHTPQASKSNTNQWLQAVTAMSGGILYGGVNLTWGYGGISSNATLQLEYSYDNGLSWVRIGEAVAGAGEYYWQSDLKQAGLELWTTSPGARWRLVAGDTNVWDMTDTYFGLRNSPFKYYVNDTSTINDVYTSAIGNDANMGFYPAAPKLSLITLLGEVDLEPTDEVYVDTGVYYLTDTNTPIRWEASDGGTNGQPVVVYGSTHADGAHFVATNRFSSGGFFFMEASYMALRGLNFAGESLDFTGNGLVVSNLSLTNRSIPNLSLRMTVRSSDSTFKDMWLDRGSFSLSGSGNVVEGLQQRWGETAISGTNVVLRNSVVFSTNQARTAVVVNAVGAVISNSTVMATKGSAVAKLGFGTLRLGHNILVAGGTNDANCALMWGDGGLVSDWNNLLARDAAWIGQRNGKWEKLSYWQAASGQDAHSVSFEPLFADEPRGDFHLKSEVGRWSPSLNIWDTDSGYHSPVIDLGNPAVGTGLETMPNGYVRNLGAYGGSVQASRSLSTLWLTALTQNDGGVLKGENVVLRWAAGNAGGKTVTLQYSADGNTWTNITTGIFAMAGSYVWNSTGFPDGFNAQWRVVAEDGSGISDATDNTFELRNHPHEFYVNDGGTGGDIYCSAAGANSNDGLTPATPKLALQDLLDAYDLEGGDTVYVDTGTYSTNANIRVIWSRSGGASADVVIQGNTNGAYSILSRSDPTNYPAVGIDVKASHIQLKNLDIRRADRGIWLESNQNVTVQGVVVSEAATGLEVEGAQGTEVRNSAFWKTGYGIRLSNTRTSVLENLTFAGSTAAGIQMIGTVVDTLQNNIFIPAAGAYAYSIGTATSLLADATMDYNLYDFSSADSGFYAGSINDLRNWQVGSNGVGGLYRDFRSAITNADLWDAEWSGDFHPQSEYGRWNGSGWTMDAVTSWAIDHGNPTQAYSNELPDNGSRLNIGMYGNTVQASKGSTNINFDIRTLNGEVAFLKVKDPLWPLVWSTHLVDGAEWVLVQFSGDGGASWVTLTNLPAYREYYVWQIRPEHQTESGVWRVIGVNDTNLVATSTNPFEVRLAELGFRGRPYPVSGLMRFDWEGGVAGKRYVIRYSDDFGVTWKDWDSKYNGPASINKSNFIIPVGGTAISYTFEDRTSYLRRQRWYRLYEY